MRLKLYRAAKMAEAMACVRAELGPDALILATRRVPDGVEVTAALEPAASPVRTAVDPDREWPLAYHDVPPALRTALGRGALDAALGGTLTFAPCRWRPTAVRCFSRGRPVPGRR